MLRGVAALAVVFWHWQHFFYVGTELGPVVVQNVPLFSGFSVLYLHGWLAVDLFFSLSGFVLFWLYADRVAVSAVSPREFAVLRLSRLYPLHLLTLILVAAGQQWFMSRFGTYFVYYFNDTRHFLLHLAFASHWGLEQGFSFNNPVWSVSVEVLLYGLFYLVCRWLPVRLPTLLLLALCGLLSTYFFEGIGRGSGSFFLGGSAYLIYRSLANSARAAAYGKLVDALAAGAWLLSWAVVWTGTARLPNSPQFGSSLMGAWIVAFLFPLTILWLAMTETRHPGFGARFAFLGNLSYSSYLWHFPLQMLTMALLVQAGASREILYSPAMLLLFFAALIALSLASHRYFEMPVQRYLRRRFLAPGETPT